MRTKGQFILDVPGDVTEYADAFYDVVSGVNKQSEAEILDNYEPDNFVYDEHGEEYCTVCDNTVGEVCRGAFEADVNDTFHELPDDCGISELQVMQFMHLTQLNSNTNGVTDIADIIYILLKEWQRETE